MTVLVILGSMLIALGRFTVPGHGLTYAGGYEAFAHIWVGVLLVLAIQNGWKSLPSIALAVISALELVMFLTR